MNPNPGSNKDEERYSRQAILPEIGSQNQLLLAKKKVAVVGVGALGTVAAELLARTGVGNLLLIDRDIVELSNLQRQLLFEENDVGRSKAIAAQEKLRRINSGLNITVGAINLAPNNVDLLQTYDLVLDCTDNLKTRFLINDFCKNEKIPWVYAAAIKTSGYVMPIFPAGSCLRCFLKETSLETCQTAGVLNMATAMVATNQALLALKILLGHKVEQKLQSIDVWNQEVRHLSVKRDPRCPTCQNKYPYLEEQKPLPALRFCSEDLYQFEPRNVNWQELKQRWQNLGLVLEDAVTIKFKEITVFKDGRVLIRAASEQEAESTYAKWIGA